MLASDTKPVLLPQLYDRVCLDTGLFASIVEIYESGVAYEVDIDMPDGSISTETVTYDRIRALL